MPSVTAGTCESRRLLVRDESRLWRQKGEGRSFLGICFSLGTYKKTRGPCVTTPRHLAVYLPTRKRRYIFVAPFSLAH